MHVLDALGSCFLSPVLPKGKKENFFKNLY